MIIEQKMPGGKEGQQLKRKVDAQMFMGKYEAKSYPYPLVGHCQCHLGDWRMREMTSFHVDWMLGSPVRTQSTCFSNELAAKQNGGEYLWIRNSQPSG